MNILKIRSKKRQNEKLLNYESFKFLLFSRRKLKINLIKKTPKNSIIPSDKSSPPFGIHSLEKLGGEDAMTTRQLQQQQHLG